MLRQMYETIKNFPEVKDITQPVETKDNGWHGPGIYFIDRNKETVYLTLVGRAGQATQIGVTGEDMEALLERLVTYRLDTLQGNKITNDIKMYDYVGQIIGLPGIDLVDVRGANIRTEKWKGEGLYNVRYDRRGYIDAVICTTENKNAGRKVRIRLKNKKRYKKQVKTLKELVL